jgi:hypothetical protein
MAVLFFDIGATRAAVTAGADGSLRRSAHAPLRLLGIPLAL